MEGATDLRSTAKWAAPKAHQMDDKMAVYLVLAKENMKDYLSVAPMVE